ncbi:hypothetical protein CHUAL_007094 [Chamberlinius hualienensis]
MAAFVVSRLISKSNARPLLLMWNHFAINRNYSTNISERKGGLWSLGKLNHVAIATPDLEKSTQFYRDILGAKVSQPVPLPEHGVITVFVELDNTKLELLLPLGENSPIKKFLETNKRGGIHHICLEVDDIKSAMEFVKKNNIECLSKEPKIGAHGKPVVFLHPRDCSGVLVELEQA